MKGVIFDMKRFAVHDGPGIRTTVFLKGCPLRCAWCHNPESHGMGVETLRGRNGDSRVGRSVSVDEVVADIERDTVFFDESGGGVTFSGGEPLVQPEFLFELLERCGRLNIHRAVVTCGHAPREAVLGAAERADLLLFDLKLIDGRKHEKYTGQDVGLIHSNLAALCATGVAIELRVPIVPGINDDRESVEKLGAFVGRLPRRLPVQLLPYHAAAMDKYRRFGMPVPLPDTPEPDDGTIADLKEQLEEMDVEVCK